MLKLLMAGDEEQKLTETEIKARLEKLKQYEELVKSTKRIVKTATGKELDTDGLSDLALILKFLDPRDKKKP
jgi:hypothetical protein